MTQFYINLFDKSYNFTRDQALKSKLLEIMIDEKDNDEDGELILIIPNYLKIQFEFIYELITNSNGDFNNELILSSIPIINYLDIEEYIDIISDMILKNKFTIKELIDNYQYIYVCDSIRYITNINILKQYTNFKDLREMLNRLIPEYENEIFSSFDEFSLKDLNTIYLRQEILLTKNLTRFILCTLDHILNIDCFKYVDLKNNYKICKNNYEIQETYGTLKRLFPIISNAAIEAGSDVVFDYVPLDQQPIVISSFEDLNNKIIPYLDGDTLIYRYKCRYSGKNMLLLSFPLDYKTGSEIDRINKYLTVLPSGMVITSGNNIDSHELEKFCTIDQLLKLSFVNIDNKISAVGFLDEKSEYFYGYYVFDIRQPGDRKEIIESSEIYFPIYYNYDE